jgi:hypothetical protein
MADLSDAQKAWLRDDNQKIILCDIEYYDTDKAENNLSLGLFSNYPYILEKGDSFTWTPSDISLDPVIIKNTSYVDNLLNIPNFVSKIDSDINIGNLEFLNAEGEYDHFLNYAWEGYPVNIYIGDPSWIKDDFILIFSSIASVIHSPRPNILSLGIRDRKEVFDVLVQTNKITWTDKEENYLYRLYEDYRNNNNGAEPFNLELTNLNYTALPIEVKANWDSGVSDITQATYAAIINIPSFISFSGPGESPIADPTPGITYPLANNQFEVECLLSGTDIEEAHTYVPTETSGNSQITFENNNVGSKRRILVTINDPVNTKSLLNNYFGIYSPGSNYYVWYNINLYTKITSNAFQTRRLNIIEHTTSPYFNNFEVGQTISIIPDKDQGYTWPKGIYTIASRFESVPASGNYDTIRTVESDFTVEDTFAGDIELVDFELGVDPEKNETYKVNFYSGYDGYNDANKQTTTNGIPLTFIPESVLNTPVPICLGKCFNVEPKLIDIFNHIYQVHEGPIEEITEVRSNGVPLTRFDPENDEIVPQYEVQEDIGCFRLLQHENNTKITCDVIGAAERGTDANGKNMSNYWEETNPEYILEPYSAAWLIEWLVLEKTTLMGYDLCPITFSKNGSHGIQDTYPLGLYISDEQSVAPIITEIMSSIGGYARFGRGAPCVLQLYQILNPKDYTGDIQLSLTEDDILEKGLSLALTEVPKASITLGYKKNWSIQDKSGLATQFFIGQDEELNNAELYSTEFSKITEENIEVKTIFPLAIDTDVIPTLIYNLGTCNTINRDGACSEVKRRADLRKQKRFVYKISSTAAPFTISLGDVIELTHSRYGFNNTKKVLVIGLTEYPTKNRVDLEVWL